MAQLGLLFVAALGAWAVRVLRPDLLPDGAEVVAQMVALLALAGLGLRLLFPPRKQRRRRRAGVQPPRPMVVVDGSNVLFWNDNQPSLMTLRLVVQDLRRRGLHPLIWFDANVGYRIGDRWQGPEELARRLDLPRKWVRVAGKGEPADPLLLADAMARGLPVVSNDRYRDWATDFPLVGDPSRMIRGGASDGSVWLDLPQGAMAQAA